MQQNDAHIVIGYITGTNPRILDYFNASLHVEDLYFSRQ